MSQAPKHIILNVIATIGAIGLVLLALTGVYFWGIDDVQPPLRFLEAKATRVDNVRRGDLPTFQTSRVVCNDSKNPVEGTLYAELVEFPPITPDRQRTAATGELITPEPRRFALGVTNISIPPGCRERNRVWQIPVGFRPDHRYVYNPLFRTCNMANKCRSHPWPSIEIPADMIEGIAREQESK